MYVKIIINYAEALNSAAGEICADKLISSLPHPAIAEALAPSLGGRRALDAKLRKKINNCNIKPQIF